MTGWPLLFHLSLTLMMSLQWDFLCQRHQRTVSLKKTTNKKKEEKTVLQASEEPRSEAKSLFNSLKVVSLPAFFCLLLLAVWDASALHLQLRLTVSVQEVQRDCGVMLCEKETATLASVWSSPKPSIMCPALNTETSFAQTRTLHTTGPVVISPLHDYFLIRNLVGEK